MEESTLENGSSGIGRETPRGTMDSVKQRVAEAGAGAKAKLESSRQPAADKMHAAADALRDKADHLPGGESVSSAAQATAEKLDASASYLESHDFSQMMDDALGIAKRYPVQALLIAGALGFLTARALRTRD